MNLFSLVDLIHCRRGVRNVYDTGGNIRGRARHLRYVLDRCNENVRMAVAAYNAGERCRKRYRAIPPDPEIRDSVRKVMLYYHSFEGEYQTSRGKIVVPAIHYKPLQLHSLPTKPFLFHCQRTQRHRQKRPALQSAFRTTTSGVRLIQEQDASDEDCVTAFPIFEQRSVVHSSHLEGP